MAAPEKPTVTCTYYTGNEMLGSSRTVAYAYLIERGKGATALRQRLGDGFQQSQKQRVPAMPNMKTSICGEWEIGATHIPEGAVICFVVEQYRGTDNTRQSLTFLKPRQNAAYRRISVPLLGLDGGRREAVFEGRFDVIDLEEAEATTGVPLILSTRYKNRSPAYGEVAVVEAEISPKPVLKTKTVTIDGEQRTIRTARRGRKLGMS